ncbi:potassium/proton antiporter, CPA1 family [Alteribacillus persepolensis]|uniref:Potassium/proton antiporter, CPA1 family n=1 Tax=Alteribacillus persepolensis TaxID=568899 RepID=A0A1G8FLN4_9BACI|nr:potassium/proton antiporter [Alteribacillus persepolensis]SDH83052.1 potassium/proton antiporter, CPA1 family [Alteribacillus persepolensis]
MFVGSFDIDYFVLLAALLLIVGVSVTKFSSRLGMPSLVLFILVGMLIGSDGLGIIYFDNAEQAQLVGIIALVIILFEGGMQTKWSTIRQVVWPSVSLATAGVLLTSLIVGFTAHYIVGLPWIEALLLGAIVGSTDAAAVFASLKERNISTKVGATMEAESGTNDPMAVFLTLTFIELITLTEPNYWLLFSSFFWQMGIGLVIGLLLGKVASISINHINLDSSGLYPIFTLSFALLTYSAASLLNASGFLAVYVAALIIGNSELTYRHSIFRFNEGFAWMAQILMFIILGLLAFPEQILSASVIGSGLLLSAVLILVARPVATFLSTIGMKYTLNEKIFLSWAGLRGAVPIVLATFAISADVESGQMIFNVVFFIVLTSALIQGSSLSFVAKKLGLSGPKKETPHHSLELISIGKANAEIIEFKTDENTPIVGQKLQDIEFPDSVLVSAIVRDENLVTPYGETEIKEDDFLYILVSRKEKNKLRKMLKHKY